MEKDIEEFRNFEKFRIEMLGKDLTPLPFSDTGELETKKSEVVSEPKEKVELYNPKDWDVNVDGIFVNQINIKTNKIIENSVNFYDTVNFEVANGKFLHLKPNDDLNTDIWIDMSIYLPGDSSEGVYLVNQPNLLGII